MTLARNRALLARDIDLKKMLVKAYGQGRCVATVHFVCRLLTGRDRCAYIEAGIRMLNLRYTHTLADEYKPM